MNQTTYLLLRLTIGTSMFGHGLVRLPKLEGFSNWMVTSFEKSLLPQILIVPFSYALPIGEFVIGFLLLTGLFTRATLIAGGAMMIILLFGTAMIEDWDAMPSQFIHATFFAMLLQFLPANNWAIDKLFKQSS